AGINASSVILSWAETLPGRITLFRIDGSDVTGQSSVETQFASGQIIVEVGFNPAPLTFTATPDPLSFMVSNKDPLPTKALTITPVGDATANWVLSTDVDWLTISPASGEGAQVVEVAVNTRLLDAGSYSGTIFVRSPVYNAEADVAVEMEMVVGVDDISRPTALALEQNYPNPFNPSTVITLDLGAGYSTSIPSLRVYDMVGREVMDLSSLVQLRSGTQAVAVDAAALPAGTYRYVLRHGTDVLVRSMTLIK
ncbi:MAG: T9SS type A sorting domain-containing protein, partial [Bacteroidota bacterium]|nr:T9SS type A sorting domain-containing protein [Bacteroidota bacterium]